MARRRTRSEKIARKYRNFQLNFPSRAERKFEWYLKREGISYQRQYIVRFKRKADTSKRFYILDFYLAGGIGIEIDGHSHRGREEYDKTRDHEIEFFAGIRIVRFLNTDVFLRPDTMLDTLYEFMRNNKKAKKVPRVVKPIPVPVPEQKKGDGTILGFYL